MDIQSSSSKRSRHPHSHSSNSQHHSCNLHSANLISLIGQNSNLAPYRSKFELNSINSNSNKSRASRDSDLLNRLAKESSVSSSKSLHRNVSANNLARSIKKQQVGSSNNSNSGTSQKSQGLSDLPSQKIEAHMMPPKIHNCVCFVAGECLNYNCNCFLSPFPCTPQCCPNCLTLKLRLPQKVTNMCSCKKTQCLRLYCQCLSKGVYCGVMCRCVGCQNHQRSTKIKQIQASRLGGQKGCNCQKSGCTRKYCQCFANGLKCTKHCGCVDCQNMIQIENQVKPVTKMIEDSRMEAEEYQLQFEEIDFFAGSKVNNKKQKR